MRRQPIDPRLIHIVQTLEDNGTLTPLEVDAYSLHAAGHGYRTIALHLGISTTSTRDRIARAKRKITAHLEQENPDHAG